MYLCRDVGVVYMQVLVRRRPQRDQSRIRDLGRKVQESLQLYQKRRVDTAGAEAEAILVLDKPLIK